MDTYEKKYKEALELARDYYKANQKLGESEENEVLSDIFPELKESEDERIRKFLIQMAQNGHGGNKDWWNKCVSWLEKQGEQKPADKVEPKFKIGDWVVTNQGKVNQVVSLDADVDGFTLDDDTYFSGSWEDNYHLWTIQDAKDGDVLLFEGSYNSIVLFQGIGINGKGRINYHCKCDLGNYSFGIQGDVACLGTIEEDAKHYHPATKEQRDLLFSKMKEAGYEWDAEKKELKKIEQKPIDKPKFKVKYAGSEYNVFETKDIAGVTFYGIEDEPNHIDYVKADNCEIISGYGIKESGLSFPTKPVMFSEQETAWSEEDDKCKVILIKED